jgi:hypothetical protein
MRVGSGSRTEIAEPADLTVYQYGTVSVSVTVLDVHGMSHSTGFEVGSTFATEIAGSHLALPLPVT